VAESFDGWLARLIHGRRTRTVKGTVKVWHRDLGRGVLVSPDAPSDVWVHFSAVEGTGYRELAQDTLVEFGYRRVHNQDGYSFVADSVRVL
jgi:CspA family cold shock protein